MSHDANQGGVPEPSSLTEDRCHAALTDILIEIRRVKANLLELRANYFLRLFAIQTRVEQMRDDTLITEWVADELLELTRGLDE